MTASVLAAALVLAGAGVLAWRPWRDLSGARPRLVIPVIVSAAAAVWAGSLGAFPARAMATVATSTRRTRGLRRRLCGVASALAEWDPSAALVPGLATPALTVGVLRPRVLVGEAFWHDASPRERAVVLAHEHAHRRARHGLVELTAQALLCPLRPLEVAGAACESLRAHLEALADDAAARTYGRQSVGRTLGHLALAEAPAVGWASPARMCGECSVCCSPTRRSTGRHWVSCCLRSLCSPAGWP